MSKRTVEIIEVGARKLGASLTRIVPPQARRKDRSSCDARHSARANRMVKQKWFEPMPERAGVKLTPNRGLDTMVTVMGSEKHAAFYRGYQPDDRSLIPVAIVLATLVALWLLVYLVSAVGPHSGKATGQSPSHSAFSVSHPANR
jgi:hypothetical protein